MNLYLECNMGASGDMLTAALADLFENKTGIENELNSLNIPDTVFKLEKRSSCGIGALGVSVIIDGKEEEPGGGHYSHHHGRHLEDVFEIIDKINAPSKVKEDAKAVYKIIAEAEAQVHGKEVGEVHFHELGMLDAIADVTAVAYLVNRLAPEKIIASPINLGNGTVKCAHGIMPVPAPATEKIINGVPCYKSDIQSELCTPTGAALIKYFANDFSSSARFDKNVKTGVSAGKKEFDSAPNILRAYLYESEVVELSCNVDDMTGEEIGFAVQVLMNAGARDAFTTPVFMKKGRPAYMLTVLCESGERERFVRLLFRHTSTIGIREYTPSRYTLKREIREDAGVHIKRSEGYGEEKEKIEFEDIKDLAIKENISIFEARKRIKEAD
ncbi:MAG: nickel pincer cofactor biosynthesis protein LarC [Eubacterium sp.]|nr:nickel pincer cofactor biosynthesis protein LarC [Eubacterium sp.]